MKPFRRRDAVLGFLAVFPLPLWENHLIDRALCGELGYLNYNKSPLLFVNVTILTLLLAVSGWFEKRISARNQTGTGSYRRKRNFLPWACQILRLRYFLRHP